ncbi:hypothetical protein GGR54DRAFT_608438 [Hypoxylon sp. NC1633]|nr:hypothetical protein GGR54DRAFT_608438 [Hypoxylon sp. NC1633]
MILQYLVWMYQHAYVSRPNLLLRWISPVGNFVSFNAYLPLPVVVQIDLFAWPVSPFACVGAFINVVSTE